MNWVQRKIYLYNVTFGLYMLDWWERCLFNTLVLVLMWFVFYNGSRYAVEFSKRYSWNPLFEFLLCLFLLSVMCSLIAFLRNIDV